MVAIVGPLAGGLTTAGAVQSEIVRGGQKKIWTYFRRLSPELSRWEHQVLRMRSSG